MRYSLWMNGAYACEAPSEGEAVTDASKLAKLWGVEVVVHDEVLDRLAHVVQPGGASYAGVEP